MANDSKGEGDSAVHYLQDTWDFFVFNYNVGTDWTQRMQKVTDFNTVEQFWSTMFHTLPPADIPNGTDLYVFKRGIKPMWEDPMNENGGRWLIQVLPNADVNFYWEELLMLIVGNSWETEDDSNEICGVVFQPRTRGSRISLWTSNWSNKDAQIRIGKRVKEVLNYPEALLYQTVDQQKNLPKGQDLDTSTYKV
nr:eukaryotic translation initiation factor 4E [Hymenolepis microstoma]